MTQRPEYVKISKDIMKFVTDQQFENYKLKFIPDCLRQWTIDLYILVEFCWNGLLKNSCRNFIKKCKKKEGAQKT